MENVKIFDHPIVTHYLTIIREKDTQTEEFVEAVTKITSLMAYDVTKQLPTKNVPIETPLGAATGSMLAKEVVIVPILRAGLGMVEGIRSLIPSAAVGHIGLYRDETTLQPKEYFSKLPKNIAEAAVYVVDPMLATGGTAIKAIELLKAQHVEDIRLVCLLGAPEGVEAVHEVYPDIPIYLAAMDEKLDEAGYIVPGLGDAGDRYFGTE